MWSRSYAAPWRARRTAFSVVELMVVVAVVGTLVSLTVPAISGSREAARRLGCANNLRQIGIALQAHHEQQQSFPMGGLEWRSGNDTKRRQLAWSAFLLPYLEQQALHDSLDLKQAFDSPANASPARQVVEVYICPSSRRGATLVQGRGPCDYGGIHGERITSPNRPPKGIMLYDRAVRAAEVRDGLSSTLIVGEDSSWPDGQWINGRNVFDQAFAINAAPAFENDIRSEHPGGAQGVFADAAVRFLPASLDIRVLAGLCTRAGKEVIPAGAY
jgi:type II secretory pathway pseudopilin PulG